MEQQHSIQMRFLAEPQDVNFGGKVHGGAVMKWIDQAGYACAVNWSRRYCVTVYVGGIRFMKPIHIGDFVEINAQVIYTGHTSMHIAVDVWAQNLRKGYRHKTTHCIIVFVAVDEEGRSVEVPRWIPQTEEQKAYEQYAMKLMERRKSIEEIMAPFWNKEQEL